MSSEANKLGDTYLDAGSDSDVGQQQHSIHMEAFEQKVSLEEAWRHRTLVD